MNNKKKYLFSYLNIKNGFVKKIKHYNFLVAVQNDYYYQRRYFEVNPIFFFLHYIVLCYVCNKIIYVHVFFGILRVQLKRLDDYKRS